MKHGIEKLLKISGETPDNWKHSVHSFARVSRKARAFLFPRGQTPQAMVGTSVNLASDSSGSSLTAMAPFGCPRYRYRGVVNPSGLCILGLASAEGLNLLPLMPVAKAIVRNSCTSACSESRLGALRRAFLLSIRHVRTGLLRSLNWRSLLFPIRQVWKGVTKPFACGRLQLLPPRIATPPAYSFLGRQSSSMVAWVVVHPLIACLDGGICFEAETGAFSPTQVNGGRLRSVSNRPVTPLRKAHQDGCSLAHSSTGQSTLPQRVARFPVRIRMSRSFIRKRKSACCGESPTTPILVENLSPAWCPGRSRIKIGGCTSLMKHGTVNLSQS